jgi:hypothetical protein
VLLPYTNEKVVNFIEIYLIIIKNQNHIFIAVQKKTLFLFLNDVLIKA